MLIVTNRGSATGSSSTILSTSKQPRLTLPCLSLPRQTTPACMHTALCFRYMRSYILGFFPLFFM